MSYITVAIAVAAFVGGFTIQGWRMDAKIAEIETTNAAAVVEATKAVAAEATRLQGKKDNALKLAQEQVRKNAVAADAARIELHRVRVEADRATAAIPTATCTSVRNYAATVTSVFGECTVALEDMARKADGHAVDSKALTDAWPTNKETK
jgi:predicted metal-dependent hydrolase